MVVLLYTEVGYDMLDRIKKKYVVNEDTGCWECKRIYPQISINGEYFYIHRVMQELYNSPIPEGKFVLHKCDNKRCVNPEHLYVGDAKQNAVDRHERGLGIFSKNQLGIDKKIATATGTGKKVGIGVKFNGMELLRIRTIMEEYHCNITEAIRTAVYNFGTEVFKKNNSLQNKPKY